MMDKIMYQVEVMRGPTGEVVAIAHGKLEPVARDQLAFAAAGFGAMIDAGFRASIWINPETGDMRLNSVR